MVWYGMIHGICIVDMVNMVDILDTCALVHVYWFMGIGTCDLVHMVHVCVLYMCQVHVSI